MSISPHGWLEPHPRINISPLTLFFTSVAVMKDNFVSDYTEFYVISFIIIMILSYLSSMEHSIAYQPYLDHPHFHHISHQHSDTHTRTQIDIHTFSEPECPSTLKYIAIGVWHLTSLSFFRRGQFCTFDRIFV